MSRPRVLFVANRGAYERMLRPIDVDRLKEFVDFDWLECDVPFDRTDWTTVPDDPAATALVAERVKDVDGLIVCHGSPRIGSDILGVQLTSLDHIMADSDVIVCVAPLTPKTRDMVGARELELIKPGSALVNVSRGPIFNPEATIARLKRGDVSAAFDVWDPEPIPADSEIRQLTNVVLTPHISSQTR